MTLGAFNVLVCDQSCDMAHIKIQGLNGSLLMQGPQTHISARLKDFIVLNVDPNSFHKKAISIVGDEVFSFSLSLTPNATEGPRYADTSKTDGRLKLSVGCIQMVYLHKFIMSLLNFSNNFQTAKAALSAATAQAAAQAALSVKDFAQKSFRLSMDIKLKAPLIIVPQNSSSQHALVMDLGLITVGNSFSLMPADGCPLPAVLEEMEVQLTQLKLSRTGLDPDSDPAAGGRPDIELLEPVNLQLMVRRNLSATWYKKMVAVEVDGDLKPMKVELSQEDLKVLLRILTENLGEAGGPENTDPRPEAVGQLGAGPPAAEPVAENGGEDQEDLENLRFNLNIESLGLVLYRNDPKQPLALQHQQELRLGELALHQLRVSGRIRSSDGLEVMAVLSGCTLDDLRTGMERASSRMVGRRDEDSAEAMIDVTYRQSAAEREVVFILQRLYLCASVEFLMAVADFFLQALPQTPNTATSDRLPLRQTAKPRADTNTASPVRTRLRAVVLDPEVVFVASLMKADTPALVASFQCDFSMQLEEDGRQDMRANLRELKVLACPFIRDQEDAAVTTVLRPCSVALETKTVPNQPLSGCVTVEEVVLKISPFILNTVMTITAAMTTRRHVDDDGSAPQEVGDLWSVRNIYGCNFWFLGVDSASEATESLRDLDQGRQGESFSAEVKVSSDSEDQQRVVSC
ncbi:vacuolar protein sorting-associated protein 13C-like [Notothenia coriiceps]|uniref:Vacuolar protein sorting-associated protein 13C-like n=1 Tax=Notothenia coriiceps TaxID=8208 RepID=A0A6I9P2C9_9TELE|nr:PREDICTED: vacuolar protein sorting-associated protein 13C-like [Notothenia coriiceps]